MATCSACVKPSNAGWEVWQPVRRLLGSLLRHLVQPIIAPPSCCSSSSSSNTISSSLPQALVLASAGAIFCVPGIVNKLPQGTGSLLDVVLLRVPKWHAWFLSRSTCAPERLVGLVDVKDQFGVYAMI